MLMKNPDLQPPKKIGLRTTPKGDQVFLRGDGSFSVKLKTGGIIHYNNKGEVITVDKEESTPWPPAITTETARSEVTPESETEFKYESGQDRTRIIKKSE